MKHSKHFLKEIRHRAVHFARVHRVFNIHGFVLVALFVLIIGVSALLLGNNSQTFADSLTPNQVGLGQGVPACGSSVAPASCNSDGTVDDTVTWDFTPSATETANEATCVGVVISSSDGINAGSESGTNYLPCSGSYTFDGLSANTTYTYHFNILMSDLYVTGEQPFYCGGGTDNAGDTCYTNTYSSQNNWYDGSSGTVSDTKNAGGTFTITHTSGSISSDPSCTANGQNPSGTLTATGCTIAAGQTTCSVPTSWVVQNPLSYQGKTDSQVSVYTDGAIYTGTPTPNVSYVWSSPNGAISSYNFNLPVGTYNLGLYTTDGTNYPVLDSKKVSVVNGPGGSCSSGSSCSTGICSSESGGTCLSSCPSGTVESGGVCLSSGCPNGTVESGGECITSSCPGSTYNSNGLCCPMGSINSGGACVAMCTPGGSCTSSGNSCGMTNTGTYGANCTCSASAPSNSLCPQPPQLSLSANPTRVRANSPTTLIWSAQNITQCSLTGPGGAILASATGNGSNNVATQNTPTAPIKGQTTYTLTCAGLIDGAVSLQTTVSLIPVFIEQ